MTPAQLVKFAGLKGRGHVAVLEQGASGITGGTLARIADVFGVSLDWLYRGNGKVPERAEVRAAVQRAKAAHEAREVA